MDNDQQLEPQIKRINADVGRLYELCFKSGWCHGANPTVKARLGSIQIAHDGAAAPSPRRDLEPTDAVPCMFGLRVLLTLCAAGAPRLQQHVRHSGRVIYKVIQPESRFRMSFALPASRFLCTAMTVKAR
jgi:hypothetical protein